MLGRLDKIAWASMEVLPLPKLGWQTPVLTSYFFPGGSLVYLLCLFFLFFLHNSSLLTGLIRVGCSTYNEDVLLLDQNRDGRRATGTQIDRRRVSVVPRLPDNLKSDTVGADGVDMEFRALVYGLVDGLFLGFGTRSLSKSLGGRPLARFLRLRTK